MRTKSYLKSVLVILLLAFSVAMITNPPMLSAAEKKRLKLKIAAGHPPGVDWLQFTSKFFCKEVVRRVNERTNYQLEILEYWAGVVAAPSTATGFIQQCIFTR